MTRGERAGLKSAVSGGQWPQAKLFTAGLADHPWCDLCMRVGEQTVGNLTHRIYGCASVERQATAERHQAVNQWWSREGSEECGGGDGGKVDG